MSQVTAGKAQAGQREAGAATCRALVVDDDEATRLLSERALAEAGIEVVGVPDGEAALDCLQRAQFDVVLLDSILPGIDGPEVLARMRDDLSTRTLPVIFVTGETDPTRLVAGLDGGADDYVTKPVDYGELAARIRALVRRHAFATHTREIIEAANDAFVAWDDDGSIVEWNAQAAAVFGWRKQEVLGRDAAETILAPSSRVAFAKALTRWEKTGAAPLYGEWVEMRGLHRDGHEIPIEMTIWAVRFSNGTGKGLSALVRSVAARNELETSLRNGSQLQSIVDATPDLIMLTDKEGVLLYLSPSCDAVLGYEPAELIGDQLGDFVHPEDRRCLAAMRHDALERAAGTTRPMRMKTADGRYLWLEVSGCPVRDHVTGEVTGFETIGRDVTLRRAAEQERNRMISTLAVAKRDLERSVDREQSIVRQLKQAGDLKDRFVANISHELRTPLASMAGYLEILLDGEAGEIDPQGVSMLDIIGHNTERLRTLVEDLLTVLRIEAGVFTLARAPVDLPALVQAGCDAMTPIADRKGVTLETHLDPTLGTVLGDTERLDRVLLALLSNAIKFTPSGGHVCVDAHRSEEEITITVADDGIGISVEDQQRLFTRFARAHHVIEEGVPGTGLGLSIAKSIMEQHGGSITLESAVGRGTTVTVVLPTAPSEEAP